MLFLSIVALVIDVFAVLYVVRNRGSTAVKAAWIVGIIVFPIIGAIAWLLWGPRDRYHSTAW